MIVSTNQNHTLQIAFISELHETVGLKSLAYSYCEPHNMAVASVAGPLPTQSVYQQHRHICRMKSLLHKSQNKT